MSTINKQDAVFVTKTAAALGGDYILTIRAENRSIILPCLEDVYSFCDAHKIATFVVYMRIED